MGCSDFTVLFDLDGTLLDTLGDLADAINYTMRTLGHPEKMDAEVLTAIGHGIRNAIVAVLPDGAGEGEIETATGIFREQYRKCYKSRTAPYPGVMDMMRDLCGKGYKIVVLSNKADEYTTGLVKKHFSGMVSAVAGERPGMPLKPDPGAIRAMLQEVGGSPGRAVFVGDSEVDVESAVNAGLPYVLMSWGFRGRDALVESGADAGSIVDTAGEALSLIYKYEEGTRK